MASARQHHRTSPAMYLTTNAENPTYCTTVPPRPQEPIQGERFISLKCDEMTTHCTSDHAFTSNMAVTKARDILNTDTIAACSSKALHKDERCISTEMRRKVPTAGWSCILAHDNCTKTTQYTFPSELREKDVHRARKSSDGLATMIWHVRNQAWNYYTLPWLERLPSKPNKERQA